MNLQTEIAIPINDIYREDFESHLDPQFRTKPNEKHKYESETPKRSLPLWSERF